jgi:ABC-type phosphate/phosphonate transport system ATPase subunit
MAVYRVDREWLCTMINGGLDAFHGIDDADFHNIMGQIKQNVEMNEANIKKAEENMAYLFQQMNINAMYIANMKVDRRAMDDSKGQYETAKARSQQMSQTATPVPWH